MKYSIVKSELMKEAWRMTRRQIKINTNDAALPIRTVFGKCLKVAWKFAKRAVDAAIEEEREISENFENTVSEIELEIINEKAPRRELVPADEYSIGQKLHSFIITGLGKTFRPNSDMFSLGITPDTDYVQYAYFN